VFLCVGAYAPTHKITPVLIWIQLFILLFTLNCAYVQKKIDQYGINSTTQDILKKFHPGEPNKLKKYIKNFDLKKNTNPLRLSTLANIDHPQIKSLNKWKITNNYSSNKYIQEKYIFKSAYKYDTKQNNAIFYVLRQSKIQNSKVIIWVPGSGVSDFAFRFIQDFFKIELKEGYNIFVYIPAYHLERTEKTKENSENFITASTLQNIKNILNGVKELRSLVLYLKQQKVKSISGWGGSMGASMLLLTENLHPQFEHLVVMIPVLDWQTVFTNKIFMKNVLYKLNNKGFTLDLLKQAYSLISPINYSLKVNSNKVQILYAKYDQLNPVKTILQYSKKNKIKNIIGYNKSHATILLDNQIYLDYETFLKKLEK